MCHDHCLWLPDFKQKCQIFSISRSCLVSVSVSSLSPVASFKEKRSHGALTEQHPFKPVKTTTEAAAAVLTAALTSSSLRTAICRETGKSRNAAQAAAELPHSDGLRIARESVQRWRHAPTDL